MAYIPCRHYSWGKGKSSSNVPLKGDVLVPSRATTPSVFQKKILAMSSVLLSFYVFWGIMSTYVIVSYYIYSKPNPRHPLHQLMMSKGCPITLRNAYIIWVPLKKTFSVSGNRRKEPYRDGDCQLCTAKVTSNSLEYRAAKPSWRTSWKSKRLGQLAEREEVDVRYLASCRIS